MIWTWEFNLPHRTPEGTWIAGWPPRIRLFHGHVERGMCTCRYYDCKGGMVHIYIFPVLQTEPQVHPKAWSFGRSHSFMVMTIMIRWVGTKRSRRTHTHNPDDPSHGLANQISKSNSQRVKLNLCDDDPLYISLTILLLPPIRHCLIISLTPSLCTPLLM